MSKSGGKAPRKKFSLIRWWFDTKFFLWNCVVETVRFIIYKPRLNYLLPRKKRTYLDMWVNSGGDREYARYVVHLTHDDKPNAKDV